MFQVINYIFNEDITWISPFEISFQSFFEGAQKTRDVIQVLNNLVFSIFLALVNCLPSPEYLWSFLKQLVVIIPYVIFSEYKQSMLKKKVYELTWALSYQLRKDMFTVVPPKSKIPFRTSTSSCIELAETRSVVHIASAPSSLLGRPRRKSTLHIGDTPVGTRLLKIKSSPVLFHGEEKRCPIVNLLEITPQDLCYDSKFSTMFSACYSFEADPQDCRSLKTEDGHKNMDYMCTVPPSPAKKFKRDTDDDSSASGYSTSLIRRVFQKPQVSLQHTFTVDYCNVLSRKKAVKCPSRVSQDISMSMGSSMGKQHVGSNESALSWKPRKSRIEAFERKWRCIIERSNNIKNERLAKLREIEKQKLLEREKNRKAEMMKRRAMITRIREQNRKILMEQRGMDMNEIEGSSDGIVLPVVRVKPIDCKQAALEEHEPEASEVDMAGQKPVLRVMQRTVKADIKREYNMMETKTLHLSDVETKSADVMYRGVVKGNTGQRVPKKAEYYLESKGTPPNRQLAYVEVRPNSGVIQNDPSFANNSMSQLCPYPISRFEDTKQMRCNFKQIANESNDLFQCTPAFYSGDLKPNSKFSEFDSPGPVVEREKFTSGYKHSSPNTASYSSDFESTIGDRDAPGGEKVAPSEDGIATSPSHCDVEALPPPSSSSCSKGRRPVMKRARRRLQKELNKSDYAQVENQTHQPDPLDDNKLLSCDSTKIEDLAQQSGLMKSIDAKVGGPKSLILKKIELRKRLEERRRAITCQNPTINQLTSAEAEKKESHGQHLESRSEITINSITRPEKKSRRFSLDGNANRTKLRQLRTAPSNCRLIKRTARKGTPTVSVMKKVNSKCSMYQPDRSDVERRVKDRQHRQSPSYPRRSVNHTVFTGRKSCTPTVGLDVRTTTDGTHCRNEVGSPINRKPRGENVTTEPGPHGNATDAQCNRQIDTPEGEKETKGQESGNNSTRDDNFASVLVLADEERKNVSPEDLKTEIRQDDDTQSERKTGSGTIDSTQSKRSDFLAFQMDESGHPVPVTQGKASSEDHRRNSSFQRRYSKQDEKGKTWNSPIRKCPTSSKRISKNVGAKKGQDTMNDREWNKRMQIWEKKRNQLASDRTSSQVVWQKSVPQPHVTFENPVACENSYNEKMEVRTEAKKSSRENQTSHANSIICLKECKENDCELRNIQSEQPKPKNGSQKMREGKRKNVDEDGESLVERRSTEKGKDDANKSTSAGHIRNQCINKKECSDKEEMVRVHSSVVQPNNSESTNLLFVLENPEEKRESQSIKRGNSSYESIESERHSEISQREAFKTQELLTNLEFSKSILSPIQSVSDNNYNTDGVDGTQTYLKMINVKQPSKDSDSIKSTTSYSSRIRNVLRDPKLEGESAIEDDLPVSCWRSSASHKLQLVEQTRNRKNTESIKSGSGTRKIQDTYRIEYPRDSEKDNATQNKRPAEKRKDCENTELIPIESGGLNIQDTCRIEYPQDSEEENEAELKIRGPVHRETTLSELAVDSKTLSCIEEEREDCKNDRELKVVCELVRKSTRACRKSKEIAVILDKLLTVTKTLKEEHLSKVFKKNHSKPLEFDRPHDRSALTAIVCYPEGSSIDDIGSLPGKPVFLDSPYTQKRILNPLVVECVASTPAEFYEKSRVTNDRFLRNRNDDDQRTATRIEWYEDFHNSSISSEELDTHQDVHLSHKEKVVDRRGCKSKNLEQGGYTNYKVKRYEIHHDASNCLINSTKRRNNELSQYH